MTRTQKTQPTAVNDDATAFVNDRTHRRTGRDLCIEQRTLTSSVVGRRQNLDGVRGLGGPLLNQRPSRVISINQFVELLHSLWLSRLTTKFSYRRPPA